MKMQNGENESLPGLQRLWTRTCRCWAKLLFSASFLLFVPSFSCSSCFRFLTFCLSLVPSVFFLVFARPLSVFVFFLLFRSLYSFLALVPLFLLLFFRFFFSEDSSYLCSSPSSMFFYSSLLFPLLSSVFSLVPPVFFCSSPGSLGLLSVPQSTSVCHSNIYVVAWGGVLV